MIGFWNVCRSDKAFRSASTGSGEITLIYGDGPRYGVDHVEEQPTVFSDVLSKHLGRKCCWKKSPEVRILLKVDRAPST